MNTVRVPASTKLRNDHYRMEHALDLGLFLSAALTTAAVSSCFGRTAAAPDSAPLEVSRDNHDLFSGAVAASGAAAAAAAAAAVSPSIAIARGEWDDLFDPSSAASLLVSSLFDFRKVTDFLGRGMC